MNEDREFLRNEIMSINSSIGDANGPTFVSPVNVPRLLTNIKAVCGIKGHSVSDIDPLYYF